MRDLFDVKDIEEQNKSQANESAEKIEVEDAASPPHVVADTKNERKEMAAFEQVIIPSNVCSLSLKLCYLFTVGYLLFRTMLCSVS